jgi:hypothetical protein
MNGYLVKCTAPFDTLFVGPFGAQDSADEFARDPRASRYRRNVPDELARLLFDRYEREVVQVIEP